MEHTLTFQTTGDSSITVPFDNDSTAQYDLAMHESEAELGDGVVLRLNRAACIAFAQLFAQLAHGGYPNDYHVHLGYTSDVPSGPGVRLVLSDSPLTPPE